MFLFNYLSSVINNHTYQLKLISMKKAILALSFVLFLGLTFLNAQTRTITGKVTDSDDGSPIPGVSLVVKGTTTGTVSLGDGTFSLTIPANSEILVISFVGMQTIEVAISGRSVVNVIMTSETVDVDEVVVVGYGVQRKKDLTSSISQLKGDELSAKASPSFMQQMAGRASGVQVIAPSGDVTAPPRIVIRGVGTISSSTAPL